MATDTDLSDLIAFADSACLKFPGAFNTMLTNKTENKILNPVAYGVKVFFTHRSQVERSGMPYFRTEECP